MPLVFSFLLGVKEQMCVSVRVNNLKICQTSNLMEFRFSIPISAVVIITFQISRGVEQACRAPLNKALCSFLRISLETSSDVPAQF